MSMGGWNHGKGAKVTAKVTVPDGWVDPWEAQQIRIWGRDKWLELKRLKEEAKKKPKFSWI